MMKSFFVRTLICFSLIPQIAYAISGRSSGANEFFGLLWLLFIMASAVAWIVHWTQKAKTKVKKQFEKVGASNPSQFVSAKTARTFLGKRGGERIIQKFEELYMKYASISPDKDPHYHLAMAWSAGILQLNKNLTAEEIQEHAFTETFLPACVSPPTCARALGLYVLYKINPGIIESQQEFQMEYAYIMSDVFQAMEDNALDRLYQTNNPNTA